MAGVCHVDKGLTSEEVTLLAILRGTPSDLRIKILQHFIEKTATVKALKVFADNLRASEVRLSGGVRTVVRPKKSGQPGWTCDRCKKPNHQAATCTVKICNFCRGTGHLKDTCFKDPRSPHRGQTGNQEVLMVNKLEITNQNLPEGELMR